MNKWEALLGITIAIVFFGIKWKLENLKTKFLKLWKKLL